MQIKRIDVYNLICNNAEPVTFAHLVIPKRAMILCKLTTDNGLVGYGEIDAPSTGVPGTIELLLKNFAPRLIGQDPTMIGKLWQDMFALYEPMGRLRSSEVYIQGGLDIALWDLLGKSCGKPISQLLGQYRTSVNPYASLGYVPLERLEAVVSDCVEKGFQSLKLRIGVKPGEDEDIIKLARKVGGDKLGIMVDVNSAWTPLNAIRNAKKLEKYNLEWIEEPLRTYHLSEVAKLAAAVDTPIATGEHEIFNRYDAKAILEAGAADIIQPDMRAGGISECKRIADLASAYEVPCIPHFYGNGIRYAAMLQLLSAIPNYLYVEHDKHNNPLRIELLENCPVMHDGIIDIPQRPGLGVTINEEAVTKYTVEHQYVEE